MWHIMVFSATHSVKLSSFFFNEKGKESIGHNKKVDALCI